MTLVQASCTKQLLFPSAWEFTGSWSNKTVVFLSSFPLLLSLLPSSFLPSLLASPLFVGNNCYTGIILNTRDLKTDRKHSLSRWSSYWTQKADQQILQNEVKKFLPALEVFMNGTLVELHPVLDLGTSEGLQTLKKKSYKTLLHLPTPPWIMNMWTSEEKKQWNMATQVLETSCLQKDCKPFSLGNTKQNRSSCLAQQMNVFMTRSRAGGVNSHADFQDHSFKI